MNNPSAPKKITWIIGLIFGTWNHRTFAKVQILTEHSFTFAYRVCCFGIERQCEAFKH
jgi:hypothetical protein